LDSSFVFNSVKVFEFINCGTLSYFLNRPEYLWELLIVLFDDLKALMRVLPVRSHMICTSSMRVMLESIELVVRNFVWMLHESDIRRDVQLLREVFHVHSKINNDFFFRSWITIADQKWACDSRNCATLQFKLSFDVLVSKENRALREFIFFVALLKSMDQLLAHEGIMNLTFFSLFVNTQLDCLAPKIYFLHCT
jgi:hypothetical protein